MSSHESYYTHCFHRIEPPLQNKNDIMNMASSLAGNFMGVVQYNRDNRAFEVSKITSSLSSGVITLTGSY